MSMLSFAPATSTFGWFGSTASAGSFCLFCENGVVRLVVPTLTSVSATKASAAAANISVTAVAIRKDGRRRVPLNQRGFFIDFDGWKFASFRRNTSFVNTLFCTKTACFLCTNKKDQKSRGAGVWHNCRYRKP